MRLPLVMLKGMCWALEWLPLPAGSGHGLSMSLGSTGKPCVAGVRGHVTTLPPHLQEQEWARGAVFAGSIPPWHLHCSWIRVLELLPPEHH